MRTELLCPRPRHCPEATRSRASTARTRRAKAARILQGLKCATTIDIDTVINPQGPPQRARPTLHRTGVSLRTTTITLLRGSLFTLCFHRPRPHQQQLPQSVCPSRRQPYCLPALPSPGSDWPGRGCRRQAPRICTRERRKRRPTNSAAPRCRCKASARLRLWGSISG